jgi:ABC-type nickel/cobalt efflux system permease component RcnA
MRFIRTSQAVVSLALTVLSVAAMAHPMGNFSVNHYSRLHFRQSGVELTYVLDLAEIPTFQLGGSWQASQWVANLALAQDGRKVGWHIRSVDSKTTDGAGGMPILRVVIVADASVGAGRIAYSDGNFPGRAGWKEIVIDRDPDAVLHQASQGATDLSQALTVYPTDPSVTPPQDLNATVDWSPAPVVTATPLQGFGVRRDRSPAPVVTATPIQGFGARRDRAPAPVVTATATVSIALPENQARDRAPAPVVTAPATSEPAPAGAAFAGQQPAAPGSVVRGDFLSRMLQKRNLGWRLMLLCVAAAFGLGCMHALSPGHGKTIVAAYLVGSRGTLKHAGLLGLVVTFTHTCTVFLLGLGVLFFQQYVVPEKIIPVLGAMSGLSIVAVGMSLLCRRAQALLAGGHHHCHHDHDHDRPHDHGSGLVHTHGGSTHSHAIEGEITPGNLIALGVGGGLVPCPSALILMLSAIALGRPGFGLVLLVGFSSGLALVLMGIGAMALYARHLLPDGRKASRHPVVRLIPVFSSVVVIVLGLTITAVSAGWIRPMRFLS